MPARHEIYGFVLAKRHDLLMVGGIEWYTFGHFGDSGVAGAAIELGQQRAC
jgi:hypothetical protein